jgi:hypothetical protein
VGRDDRHLERLDDAGQARRLSLGQVEHEPRQRRGVQDRVAERRAQPAGDQVGVEGVVAVLHQHRAPGEAQEGAPRDSELGRAGQHRAVDLVPLARVRVDGGAAVHEGVEDGDRPGEAEALSAYLQDQEGAVARRLHVQGDELRLLEGGTGADRLELGLQLLVGEGLAAARLQVDRPTGRVRVRRLRLRRLGAVRPPAQ